MTDKPNTPRPPTVDDALEQILLTYPTNTTAARLEAKQAIQQLYNDKFARCVPQEYQTAQLGSVGFNRGYNAAIDTITKAWEADHGN